MNPRQKVVSRLNDLITLDRQAVAAYRVALEKLRSAAYRFALKEFSQDHDRHIASLMRRITEVGGTPLLEENSGRRFVGQSPEVIAQLDNDDHGVLGAMLINEMVTNVVYERALMLEGLYPAIRDVLEVHLSDERRHRLWLEKTLGVMRLSAA